MSPRRRLYCWIGALPLIFLMQGCVTAIVIIPTECIQWDSQLAFGLALGVPSDIAIPTALGASLGPPGALVGAIVGVALAAYDLFVVYELHKL